MLAAQTYLIPGPKYFHTSHCNHSPSQAIAAVGALQPAVAPSRVLTCCYLQVCRALIDLGHSVTVITGQPAGFFLRELSSPRLAVRKAGLDFGAKQLDAFSVDMSGA